MNKSTQFHFVIFAAGAAGVATFSLANASFTAGLRGDVILGVGATLVIIGLAIFDYSRPSRPLVLPVRLLRPTRPVAAPRAYECKDSRKDCLAA